MAVVGIREESPPDIPCNGERVTLMRERFVSIKNNYAGMLYFCQRITGIESVGISDLQNFEIARFHTAMAYQKNMSFPVSSYIDRINDLEKKVIELGGEL